MHMWTSLDTPLGRLGAPDEIADGILFLASDDSRYMTGAELVRRVFTEHGYVTLIHPVEGPVNLYRTSRFASAKQRLMAAAENPVCPWPECRYPADECQVHHLNAWKMAARLTRGT